MAQDTLPMPSAKGPRPVGRGDARCPRGARPRGHELLLRHHAARRDSGEGARPAERRARGERRPAARLPSRGPCAHREGHQPTSAVADVGFPASCPGPTTRSRPSRVGASPRTTAAAEAASAAYELAHRPPPPPPPVPVPVPVLIDGAGAEAAPTGRPAVVPAVPRIRPLAVPGSGASPRWPARPHRSPMRLAVS